MRIISGSSQHYSGGGYHYGSVWPLFTGWASVAEYRHHQQYSAYLNLQANAQLALDGAPGHVTEVLSGDYYQPLSTSSPHQIWSAAMVVSPMLRGLLGLESDAINSSLKFAPHVPAQWNEFGIENVRVGLNTLALRYTRSDDGIQLAATRTKGAEECTLEFRPAISPRAKVVKVELNGKPVPFRVDATSSDQHVVVRMLINEGKYTLRIQLVNDFELGVSEELPALGSTSQGIRVISESWTPGKDQLTLELAGAAGRNYLLAIRNASQIQSVDGAENISTSAGTFLSVRIPAINGKTYVKSMVVLHFAASSAGSKRVKH
jgi:hypothetical protein